MICIDQGVLEVLRYFMNSRAGWPTTYYTLLTKTGYFTPTLEEFQAMEQAIAEANQDMSSCNDIVAALQGIAEQIALTGQQASGGCGCVTGGDTEITDVNDGPTQEVPQPSDPLPPGFPTRPDYDDYRCKAAYWLIRQYVGTLRNWGGLAGMTGGLTVAVIVGLALLTIPPLGLTIILAALGTLLGINAGLFVNLTLIADAVEDDIDNLACQLYNAVDTSGAAFALYNAASLAINDLDLGAIAPTFETICQNLISNDACQALFVKNDEIDALPNEDCSSCESGPMAVLSGQYCTETILSGDFSEDTDTEILSCLSVGQIEGAVRHQVGMNGATYPANIRWTIVDATPNSYIALHNIGTNPQPVETFGNAAALIGQTWDASALQIAGWLTPNDQFTIIVRVETIP